MRNLIRTEPVLFFGGLQAVLMSVIGLLTAFNAWNPSDVQIGAVTAAYATLTAFITFLVRQSVSPYPGGPLTPS